MSIASEITRLQNAKSALKTSINAKTDSSHQIDNETLDEYSDFVDSIQTGDSTGSNVFIVTGTDNGGTYTIDKTFQELVGAYTEGKPMVYIDTTGSTFLNVNMIQGEIIGFTGSIINIDSFTSTMKVKIMSIRDGMIFADSKNYSLTPAS